MKTRKEDIVRRKAGKRRAREERELIIAKEEERLAKMEAETLEAEGKFQDEHREEIEAAQKYEQLERDRRDDDYGEEGGEEDEEPKEKLPKEKPIMPVFNREEFINKWIEEYSPLEIPE